MRLSIGFACLLVTIAFVQSKPLLNGAFDFNGAVNQFVSQNNLVNQFGGLAAQVNNALSSGQLQTLGLQVYQLAQNVLNGNLDANVAASQFLAQVQQYLSNKPELYNAVANAVQQLLNLSGFGLARPALSRQFQIPLADLQGLLAQNSQYADLANQASALVGQVLNVVPLKQLQALQKQAVNLAQQVLSGKVTIQAAAAQVLGALQPFLASNTELFNKIQSFVQQAVTVAQSFLQSSNRISLPSPADLLNLANQYKPSDLQGILAQYSEYAGLINQATGLAGQVFSALSQAKLEQLGQQVYQLAQDVFNGKVSVNAATAQLLGALQTAFGSNTQLFNQVQSFVQQVINVAQPFTSFGTRISLPSPADLLNLANQYKPSDLQGLLGQYPQYAGLVNQATALAGQVASALSEGQLLSLGQQVYQLAQDVFNGKVSVNAATAQLLGALQSAFGSNTQLFNQVQSFVQQVVNAIPQ